MRWIDANTYLELETCEHRDGGRALVDAIGYNQGPGGLDLHAMVFLDRELDLRAMVFLDRELAGAIRVNSRLKEFCICFEDDDDLKVLAASMKQNHALTVLTLCFSGFDQRWNRVLQSLRHHPALKMLVMQNAEMFDQPLEL